MDADNLIESRTYLTKDSWIDMSKLKKGLITFDEIWDICPPPEDRGKIMMMGKLLDVPRFQKSYGISYKFSKVNHIAEPIPDFLSDLHEWVNTKLGYGSFNQLLINWYVNGHHYIGKHSDDETQLIPGSPIVSISLGAERKFRMRPREKSNGKTSYHDFNLVSGDIIVMGGKTQKEFTHEIVKVSGVKGENVGKRINITFRQFKV